MKFIFLILTFFTSLIVTAQNKGVSDLKVGLVLSGGGAKGYAHVGVLKALEEAGVRIDYIGGTSMGAIVGGLYAMGYSADELQETISDLDFRALLSNDIAREFKPVLNATYPERYVLSLPIRDNKLSLPFALSKGQKILEQLVKLTYGAHNVQDFSKLPIPFFCIATNLANGEQRMLEKGFLPRAIMASSAYPSLVDPVEINGELLTDGGIVNNIPVREVREKGMDIVIAVDLQEGLVKKEDLKSITEVLEQIISFQIEKSTNYQLSDADMLISPNVLQFGVTDFEKKEEIISLGYDAASNLKTILQEIAKLQSSKRKIDGIFSETDSIYVSKLSIKGGNKFNERFMKGKLKLNIPSKMSYKNIQKRIDNLYGTDYYNTISYNLKPFGKGQHLELNVYEKEESKYIKLGAHYDEIFKTGVLVNATIQNLITRNDMLSADFILGDFLRYDANYFIDNGLKPSFGIKANYTTFKSDIDNTRLGLEFDLGRLAYDFHMFNHQVYLQSTLKNNYAFGMGLEYKYNYINTNQLSKNIPQRVIENDGYFGPFAYLKTDTRDDKDFPTEGLVTTVNANGIVLSGHEKFTGVPIVTLNGNIEYNKKITSKLTLKLTAEMGTYFGKFLPESYKFSGGGTNRQKVLNYQDFYGYKFLSLYGNHKLGLGTALQYSLFKNAFVSLHYNSVNYVDEFKKLRVIGYEHNGYGLRLGYRSPVGPIELGAFNSPEINKINLYFSIGHWF